MLYGRQSAAEHYTVGAGGVVVQAEVPAGLRKSVKQKFKDQQDWQWSPPVFMPPIISQEDWLAVQQKLQTDRGTRRPKSDKFLCSGLVRCGMCGAVMSGVRSGTGRNRVGYRCSSYIRRHSSGGPDTDCGAMDVNQTKLTEALDAWIEQQAEVLTVATTGDERFLLRGLFSQRASVVDSLRDARRQIEEWLMVALAKVDTPETLPDGRQRYTFPMADGEP